MIITIRSALLSYHQASAAEFGYLEEKGQAFFGRRNYTPHNRFVSHFKNTQSISANSSLPKMAHVKLTALGIGRSDPPAANYDLTSWMIYFGRFVFG
jgi:hypothetical protein